MTITWANVRVKLGDLKPWGNNPRMSTKAQAKRLLASFEQFGQVETIAVGPDFGVYNGHQRLSALLTIHGKGYEVDARQSDRALTEDERKQLTVYLHAGAVGQWDWDALSGWDAPQLQEWGMNGDTLKDWTRDVTALGEMLASEEPGEPKDAEPQIDRAEELRAKWGVEPGQLWQLGEHRLLCGDCTKAEDVARVMQGEKADAVVTDPPYGMALETNYRERKRTALAQCNDFAPIAGDDRPFDPSPWLQYPAVVLFGANWYADRLPPSGAWIVWDKLDGLTSEREVGFNDNSDCELAWTNLGDAARIYRHRWMGAMKASEQGERRVHPTQKPVALMQWCIEMVKDAMIVLDPYCGSAPVLIACENLGRKARCIEISPGYVAVALERWATATGKTPSLIQST